MAQSSAQLVAAFCRLLMTSECNLLFVITHENPDGVIATIVNCTVMIAKSQMYVSVQPCQLNLAI